jgi:hypothetical protein
MLIVCDPGRHAIYVHFGTRATLWDGPQVSVKDAKIVLFVDDEAKPTRLNGILFLRHQFYLPYHVIDPCAVDNFSLRCYRDGPVLKCELGYASGNTQTWHVYRGVEILVEATPPTGNNRFRLAGFRVDTRVLNMGPIGESIEIDISSDSLKTN